MAIAAAAKGRRAKSFGAHFLTISIAFSSASPLGDGDPHIRKGRWLWDDEKKLTILGGLARRTTLYFTQNNMQLPVLRRWYYNSVLSPFFLVCKNNERTFIR